MSAEAESPGAESPAEPPAKESADSPLASEPNAAAVRPDDVEAASFESIEPAQSTDAPNDVNLDMVLNVSVDLSLEVGRAQISVRDLLQLNQGSVVELDRLAGEPLDVLINGTLIAHGEVVVVNDQYGLRLTDVVSPSDRIKQIQ